MGTYSKKQRHDQHRTRDRIIHSFLSSALILFLVFLPIAAPAERFGAAIYTVSAVGSSSAGASPFAVYHRLSWVPESTVATCTMTLQSSLDGASWSTIVGPATCTSAGFATSTAVTARYVRVNVSTLTGGRVLVGYSGYDSDPAGAGVSAVSVTSGTINSATISSMPAITGTVQSNAGTGTVNVTCISGCGGAASFTDTGAFTFGTTPINIMGAVVDEVATNTVAENAAAAPRMTPNRILYSAPSGTTTVAGTLTGITGTVTSTPSGTTTITGTVSATSGTINSSTISSIPSLTVTSGTVNSSTISSIPSLTVTSGTVNSSTISSMPAITGTVQANAGTGTLNVAIGATGTVQANAGTGTLNVAIGSTGTVQANAGTGTLGIDLAKVLGAALTTANPVIDGGRASTDTTASVADGVARALRLDKFGDVVFVVAPQDLQTSVRAALTNTTASSMIGAPGANYKYAITLLSACNLAATIAGQVDITDSSGTLYSFPWTQTSSAPGEPRCIILNLGDGDPIYSAANSSISAKATVANGTGFTINIAAHKTGT